MRFQFHKVKVAWRCQNITELFFTTIDNANPILDLPSQCLLISEKNIMINCFLSNQTKPSKVLDKDIQSNKGRIWKLFSLFDPQNMAEVHKWLQLCLRTNDKYPDIEIYCPLPTKYNNYSLFANVLLKSNFSM